MRRFQIAIAFWLACLSSALGADPFALATIDNQGTIVPGQQVHLTVDVFAPNFFTSPPQFPLFDLPNTIVSLSDERAQNLTQTVDDVQYSGIRRAYTIVPEMAGTFTLPEVIISFDYSDDGKTVKGTARVPATTFTVGNVPGGNGGTLPFAARGVVLTQSFDRDPAKLKAGEALVRTITAFGKDTQAMMIPALELGQTEGLNAYPKPPAIADDVKNADGNTGSSRTQIITYIASDAGTYTIPAISLGWFDLDSHAAKTASLPATVLTVANVPNPTQAIAPELQTQDSTAGPSALSKTTIALVMGALCLIAGISWLVRRLMPSINARLSAWRDAHRNSEKMRFKELAAAIRKDDTTTIYRRLEVWSRSAGFRSIGDWVSDSHDMNVAREIGTLERGLFAGARDGSAFDRAALLRAITAVRHIHIRPQRSRDSSRLPPLNPAGRPLGVTPPVSKGYTG